MNKKMAIGWASAHIGNLLEDGIYARSQQNNDMPAEVMWCEPYNGSFVIKFGSESDDDLYVRLTASLTDSEGNEL
jgi:hypothetical protein